MDSKPFAALCVLLLLCGCGSDEVAGVKNDKGYGDNTTVGYWHSTRLTADNAPDPVKTQRILEDDLVACGYEVRDYSRWARNNNIVSDPNGNVVDQQGVYRSDTSLPETYEISDCMERKGWVRLKHYYTAPY